MNKIDREAWIQKTKKLNTGKTIAIGNKVKDVDLNKGIVVKIIMPDYSDQIDIEDHGTIYVWQSERTKYGDDNCEHYTYSNWDEWLRILN
jgi:hypothetical protein